MIGNWILIFGIVLVVVGAVVWLVESLDLPLDRLPGDIRMRGDGWSFGFLHLAVDQDVLNETPNQPLVRFRTPK